MQFDPLPASWKRAFAKLDEAAVILELVACRTEAVAVNVENDLASS